MSLTEEEKQKIIEQEEYRLKVKEQEAFRSQIQNTSTNNDGKSKGTSTKTIVWVILILLFIVSIFVLSKKGEEYRQDISPLTTSVSKNTNNLPQNTNINVTRQTVIQALKSYSFKKSKEYKSGQENYTAKNNIYQIELLGPSDNLNSASFTVYLTKGTQEERLSAMKSMTLFGNSVDMACGEWFTDQLIKEADKTKIYSNNEIACGRHLSFYYFPGDTFTFGIEP